MPTGRCPLESGPGKLVLVVQWLLSLERNVSEQERQSKHFLELGKWSCRPQKTSLTRLELTIVGL